MVFFKIKRKPEDEPSYQHHHNFLFFFIFILFILTILFFTFSDYTFPKIGIKKDKNIISNSIETYQEVKDIEKKYGDVNQDYQNSF